MSERLGQALLVVWWPTIDPAEPINPYVDKRPFHRLDVATIRRLPIRRGLPRKPGSQADRRAERSGSVTPLTDASAEILPMPGAFRPAGQAFLPRRRASGMDADYNIAQGLIEKIGTGKIVHRDRDAALTVKRNRVIQKA